LKEFYKVANKVLRIKRNHPVVSRVKRDNETGESEVFEDRSQVEQVIAEYFAEIYKRPDHMQANPNIVESEDDEMVDEMINTTALFSMDDIREATK
jgi:hypothetical protein